jgi:hypothetical protein
MAIGTPKGALEEGNAMAVCMCVYVYVCVGVWAGCCVDPQRLLGMCVRMAPSARF